MRRIFETDAVIIAALILVAGTYKMTTSEDVQNGFVRLVQQLRNDSEVPQPNDQVAQPETVNSTISDSTKPDDIDDIAGVEFLPPAADVSLSQHGRPPLSTYDEQLAQAVARGRERLAKSRVHAVEIHQTSGYTRSCSPRGTVRSSCGQLQ